MKTIFDERSFNMKKIIFTILISVFLVSTVEAADPSEILSSAKQIVDRWTAAARTGIDFGCDAPDMFYLNDSERNITYDVRETTSLRAPYVLVFKIPTTARSGKFAGDAYVIDGEYHYIDGRWTTGAVYHNYSLGRTGIELTQISRTNCPNKCATVDGLIKDGIY